MDKISEKFNINRSIPYIALAILIIISSIFYYTKYNPNIQPIQNEINITTSSPDDRGSGTIQGISTQKYILDKTQSKLEWSAKKVLSKDKHTGLISLLDGEVNLDPNNQLNINANFTIDMNSITNSDLTIQTMNQTLVKHLKGEDFFDTQKFPTSTLAIKKVEMDLNTPNKNGETNVLATGDLSIKGSTQQITFPASIMIVGNTLTAQADIMIDRTKFGIKYNSKQLGDFGDKMIDDNFNLKVYLVLQESV